MGLDKWSAFWRFMRLAIKTKILMRAMQAAVRFAV